MKLYLYSTFKNDNADQSAVQNLQKALQQEQCIQPKTIKAGVKQEVSKKQLHLTIVKS